MWTHTLLLFRGFVWSAHEGGPVHHQRSRDFNARGDAYVAPELWVKTIILLLENQRKATLYFLSNKPLLSHVKTVPFHAFYRNIFLGETFSSYISVHNDSNQVVKDILVKVKNYLSGTIYPLHTVHSSLPITVLRCDAFLYRLTYRPAPRGSTSLPPTLQ